MSIYDAYVFLEKEMKHKHLRIFEFILNYVAKTGSLRGAFKEAAKMFYPDKPLNIGIKRAWDLFMYAYRKRFGTKFPEFSENISEMNNVEGTIEYNMNYYIENHGGPVREPSKFVKDSRANRRLFELKKIVYAVLGELVKPKHVLTCLVEEVFKDPRLVIEINRLNENVWYSGKRYIKLDKKAAALLYIIVYRIYARHYGVGNRPERLIRKFFEVTGYAPRDLGEYIKAYIVIFYDWLLFL